MEDDAFDDDIASMSYGIMSESAIDDDFVMPMLVVMIMIGKIMLLLIILEIFLAPTWEIMMIVIMLMICQATSLGCYV